MKDWVGKRELKGFRVVNPVFGEWLYGLPQHWTDAKRHIRAPPADPPLLKSFDVFTGVGGLTLACKARMWRSGRHQIVVNAIVIIIFVIVMLVATAVVIVVVLVIALAVVVIS